MRTKIEYQQMTNDEFLEEIMNFSNYGSLCQIATIQALEVGLKEMLKTKEEGLKQHEDDNEKGINPLIHIPSWYGVLEEIANKFQLKYGEWKSKTDE